MPDFTMCSGVSKTRSCSNKSTCYRYTATPNEFRQSWFIDLPLKEDGTCDSYWPTDNTKKKARDEKAGSGTKL